MGNDPSQRGVVPDSVSVNQPQNIDSQSDSINFPFGLFLGGWYGQVRPEISSNFFDLFGMGLSLEYGIIPHHLTAYLNGSMGTASSTDHDILYQDGSAQVPTTMNILSNIGQLHVGLLYQPYKHKLVSPIAFAQLGRTSSLTMMTVQNPDPGDCESSTYVNRGTMHRDGGFSYGYGLGLRFEFTRLCGAPESAVGILDLRATLIQTVPIEYMNAELNKNTDLQSGDLERFAENEGANRLFSNAYYSDNIYKSSLSMLYFSVAVGVRFNKKVAF